MAHWLVAVTSLMEVPHTTDGSQLTLTLAPENLTPLPH